MANKTINQLTAVSSVAATDEMEVQKSGETTTKKATVQQVLATEATARANQDDVIEASVGLKTDGTFDSMNNSWLLRDADFTTGATDRGGATGVLTKTIRNALRLLDAKIYTLLNSVGLWQRTGTTLSPLNDGDDIGTTGKVHGNSATFGDETEAGNYVEITTDGNIVLHGDATYWIDMRTPGQALVPGGAANPSFYSWVGTLRAWQFTDVKTEELFFMVHLPHAWKEGSKIFPHIHWFPTSSAAGATKVRWGLEYVWLNKADIAGATTTIYTTDIQPSENPVGYKHYRSDFSEIDGVGKTHSSQIVCRLFRTPTHADDTMIGNAGLLEFDFHIECDGIGSNTISSKL